MKAIIALLVLGGLVLGGVYMFGGYSDFDPDKQADTARAAVKSGMTLKQVTDVAGKNPKYRPINVFTRKVGKETIEEERPGTPVPFDYDKVAARIKNDEVKNGFILTYTFSERKAFSVHFDSTGTVIDVADERTVSELFESR